MCGFGDRHSLLHVVGLESPPHVLVQGLYMQCISSWQEGIRCGGVLAEMPRILCHRC